MKPRMFIASSVEQVELAYAVQEGLEHDVEPTVWTQGVFALSKTSMASLMDVLDESDFGLFVLAPDDVTAIQDKTKQTVRDNVIFELGLFIGRLGTDRCFLIVPRGAEELHIPSDLLGLTPASFPTDRQDGNLVAAVGPACNRIRKAVAKLGPLKAIALPLIATVPAAVPEAPNSGLIDDPNDCISLIESWMGRRGMSENRLAIRFADVDRELKLAPGSARKHIQKAASRWNYVKLREGKDTITFHDADLR